MYALGRLVSDIPVGMLADRSGRKRLMVLGTAILSVTSFLNANAANFGLFLLYRTLEGVGSAMWITSRQALLADILKPHERGRIMGYFQAFMLIGSATGPTIGGIVATIWDLRAPFYFYAVAGVVSLILTVIGVREPKRIDPPSQSKDQISIQVITRLMSNRTFIMTCLATFTAFFIMTGIRATIIPLYANNALGLNEIEIGTVLSFATLMNLIMTVPMGYAIDYFGRKPIIVVSLVVQAASAFLFPSSFNYVTISLVALLLGIGQSGATQAPLAMAADATIEEPHGIAMGVYRCFGDIGFVLGPITLGLISDNYGLKMPFYSTSVIVLASMILVAAFANETYRSRGKTRAEREIRE